MSTRAQFNELSNWISQFGSMAESVISKEVILWLAITLSSSLRTVRMHLMFKWVLPSFHMYNLWASLLQYTQLIDRHAHWPRKTPNFELQNFFGQLNCIFIVELPSTQWLNLDRPTMVILALIWEVKASLRNGIYYYKNFGADKVVNLSALQCVVRRVQDRAYWSKR